jgi:hypothetical protein
VEAIDANVPSISVRTASGNKLSYKVEDGKNLEGVKAVSGTHDGLVLTHFAVTTLPYFGAACLPDPGPRRVGARRDDCRPRQGKAARSSDLVPF